MDWFWTWGGECFGHRRGDGLFTHTGHEVGRFKGEEIYGSDSHYLGEVKSRNRLITDLSKKNRIRGSFAPRLGGSYVRYVNYVGHAMYAGYEDFPGPKSFES
jgi:hypothetical protein